MAEKTAVDWLFEQIPAEWSSSKSAFEAYQQAKQMEKEQVKKAVDSVQLVNRYYHKNGEISENLMGREICTDEERTYIGLSTNGIKYYNETFGK